MKMEKIHKKASVLKSILKKIRSKKLRRIGEEILKEINSCESGYSKEVEHLKEGTKDLEIRIKKLTETKLTRKQKLLLNHVSELSGAVTFTGAIGRLSKKLEMPYSTVKWNLSKLRSAGLIEAGDKSRQSIPLRITKSGELAIEKEIIKVKPPVGDQII